MSSVRYRAPAPADPGPAFLVAGQGTPDERWCAFYDLLEIGRDDGDADPRPGLLLVADATVSRSHCVLTYRSGRCFVRDRSRNGTRVDGRRIVPNVDVEVRPRQTLRVGEHHDEFIIVFEPIEGDASDPAGGTLVVPSRAMVTVLVGDIRDYTRLVRLAPSADVQPSIRRVFRLLTTEIAAHDGTVKEFQGDALVAFWEGTPAGEQAVAACRAALDLDALVQQLAADPSRWRVASFPLQIDWALASGPVLIDSFGHAYPAGLSMVGEAPTLAFRLEKFASDRTGRILTCAATWATACGSFRFRDLGEMVAKGFDRPDHVFALEGPLLPAAARH